nr:unnamed protein product [Digitaria exilis]
MYYSADNCSSSRGFPAPNGAGFISLAPWNREAFCDGSKRETRGGTGCMWRWRQAKGTAAAKNQMGGSRRPWCCKWSLLQ